MVLHLKAKSDVLSPREDQFLQGIERVELKTPLDRTSSSSGTYTTSKQQARTRKQTPQNHYLGDLFDRSFPVDTWWPVLRYHQGTLQKVIETFKPDVLWSTADPWSSHLTAMALTQKNKIPWVADFRDPWTLCPIRSRQRMPWAKAIDKNMESKVLTQADQVVFTAANTTRIYRDHYAGLATPMSTIYNSFDDEFFLPLKHPKNDDVTTGKFNILFYGRFRALSSAGPVIKLLETIKELNPEVFESITVQSCGELPKEDAIKAESSGVIAAFETVSSEPYENTFNRLDQADVLLLSTEPSRNEIIPAKLWDYLIAGKPIISLSQNPEVDDILRQTKTGAQFAMHDMDKAANLAIESFKARKRGIPLPYSIEADKEKIQAYSSVNATARLAGLFDQLKG